MAAKPVEDLWFRLATPADQPVVSEIYRGVCAWLHDVKGIADQWERDIPEQEIENEILSNQFYLAYLDREPAGGFKLTEKDEIWQGWDGAALYVHSLAIRREFAGRGLGRRVLDSIQEMARARGKQYVRLDCMYENPGLRQYYVDAGFEFLGQHPRHAWYALFQKKTSEG